MKRPLDEVLGIKKTAATHDLKVGDRVKTVKMSAFRNGREGEIKSIDQWGRLIIKFDILSNFDYPIHHSYVERI